jgi:hypothetical protein
MKSKSFSKAKRYTCSSGSSIRWAKQIRSRIERRYTRNKLHDIIFVNEVEDFDILPLPQTKPGYWAWVIS